MKVLVILLLFFGLVTTLGINESFADCNSPHCYAEWTNGGATSAKGIKTDMQVSDVYIFPDESCVNDIVVESIWMDLPSNGNPLKSQWIEVGVTTGSFTEGTGTDARCITNKQAYVASSNTYRTSGPVYQEFALGRQLDSGDTVQLEILESLRDRNNVNYQPKLTDAGLTFYGESPGWNGGEYPTNFRVGIESTVEPKKQYSPAPQVKFTNTQVNLGAGYNDFVTPGNIFATVNVNDGYKRMECPNGSLIAGTVTELDCNLSIGKNQRPTIQNSVKVINVESFRPHVNYMTLEATDTDNEYVFFSISDESHQGSVVATIDPSGNLKSKTPTSAEFKFVPVTGVSNDVVTFKVSDGRVGHDREIQYHFIQGTQGLPDAIDDLSASLSGNMVTLNWSHPSSDTAFRDVQIDFRVNDGAWRETCQATRSSETTCTTTVGSGLLYEYRVKIKNTIGYSEYSNVVQLYSPDTTAPSIYRVSPANNQVFTTDDIITISGRSFDVDSGVSRVTLSLDGNTPIQASGTTNWTWTFDSLDEGYHTVSIVSYNGDGYFTTHPLITFEITSAQVSPILSSINDVIINEGNKKFFTVSATDDNNDSITYSLSNSPDWVTISGVTITISAPSELSGTSYSVTVRATDNDGSDTESFRININEINQAPILSSIGNKSITETSTLSFSISATDSDRPSQSLRYSMSGSPTGSTINSSTGLFTWTPTESQSGTYSVTFKVTDNGSPAKSDSETISIIVIDKQVPPVLSSISDVTINEGDTKSFTVSATDDNNDTITYSLSNSPDWVTISGDAITISAPSELSDTSYSGTVTATDNDGSDTDTFTINITEVNQIPSLGLIDDINSEANQIISFTITASDSDIACPNFILFHDR